MLPVDVFSYQATSASDLPKAVLHTEFVPDVLLLKNPFLIQACALSIIWLSKILYVLSFCFSCVRIYLSFSPPFLEFVRTR